ncbi:MAG: hypothetical protein NTU53_21350 [Planctomycetota bacterium]|nr:hypothetical protein [Planctomycetota bacterium]
MITPRNSTTGKWGMRGRAAARRSLACAVLVLVTAGPGCVEKVTQTTQYLEDDKAPASASRTADQVANQESGRRLSEVKWTVLERKGPKSAWEQFGGKEISQSGDQGSAKSARRTAKRTPPPRQYMQITLGSPATQPSTRPTTQPVVQTITVPVISEDGLPVQVVPLPDGKVRLIWNLRSYGGTNVTSARDVATARRNVTVTPPDLIPLVTVLQQQLGAAGMVTPLPRENTVVVTCDRIMQSSVLDMLSRLDVPPKQVEISAKIFEVSRDFDLQQGARLLVKHLGDTGTQTALSTFDTQKLMESVSQGTQFQGSVLSLMKTFEGAGVSVESSFQLLADAGLIRVVSSPRMTVAAGQTGYMLAGQELPIQSANFVNNVMQTTTLYKPVGVQLYITPQAVGEDRVKLHTISIVSSVSGFAPLPTLTGGTAPQALINPIIESREAETAVTVNDGSTLVISGLRMSRTTTREAKIPGLGDIPILGWLFKNHRSQQQLTDLYFFVTPTLLDVDTQLPLQES